MTGLRKAALLLSGLEWQTVDLLLGRLDSESAKAVRREMMSLGTVSVKETDRLANEFLRKAGRKHRQPSTKSPNTIEHQLPEKTTYNPSSYSGEPVCYGAEAFTLSHCSTDCPTTTTQSFNRPFDFLRYSETDDIVGVISEEHPQTVAVVLAHLPASRAGTVLGRLPVELRNDVTQRLTQFQETDKQILQEIELTLRERLERCRSSETRRTKSNAVLRKIVETSQAQETNQAFTTTEFSEQFNTFDDLEHLNDMEILTLFRSVDTIILLTALIGAKPSLIERITKHLSPTEEYQMRQQLKHLGTINENDVIHARTILLERAELLLQ
ncbi:MAG: hypothetical protein LBI18_01250 [Planctomycetaceae bacterium]|jgi:flagellar motor switch protein FliG|nr:hypothetical protein [Planctomycetaceae bacterium]